MRSTAVHSDYDRRFFFMTQSPEIGSTFWERFRLLVPNFGSQAEVARRLGIAPSTVGGWTKGDTTPDKEFFKLIKEEYGLTFEETCYLHWGKGPPPGHTKTSLKRGGGMGVSTRTGGRRKKQQTN